MIVIVPILLLCLVGAVGCGYNALLAGPVFASDNVFSLVLFVAYVCFVAFFGWAFVKESQSRKRRARINS